jgi:hypothetical protein
MPSQSNRRQPTGAAAARHATAPRANLDPGAYIGRKPERVAETVPGGLGPNDRRASAVATQPAGPSNGATPSDGPSSGAPEANGRTDGTSATEGAGREAHAPR